MPSLVAESGKSKEKPRGKEGFAMVAGDFYLHCFWKKGYFISFHYLGQKPKSAFSFLPPGCVPSWGYYYLTTKWWVAANVCVPKSIRHFVITFYRKGIEGFVKGLKRFNLPVFGGNLNLLFPFPRPKTGIALFFLSPSRYLSGLPGVIIIWPLCGRWSPMFVSPQTLFILFG